MSLPATELPSPAAMAEARLDALPPYTEKRLGPTLAAESLQMRRRLHADGITLPAWIDARPGRLRWLIGDCAADPPLGQTTLALVRAYGDLLLEGLGALGLASAAPELALFVADPEIERALATLVRGCRVTLRKAPAVWPAQPDLDIEGAAGHSITVPATVLARAGAALRGRPAPRLCTVAGAVARPGVVSLDSAATPLDLVRSSGGATVPAWVALAGGAPGGRLWAADAPLPAHETLLLVLPYDHEQVRRLRRPLSAWVARAAAVCGGCQICTDACPQHLRGAPLRPHALVRRFAGLDGRLTCADDETDHAELCTGCGACDVLCPHGLAPRLLVQTLAADVRPDCADLERGAVPRDDPPEEARLRRLPRSLLLTRLGLDAYRHGGS